MQHVASERIAWKKALRKESPLLLPVAHDALTGASLNRPDLRLFRSVALLLKEAVMASRISILRTSPNGTLL